MCSDLTSLFICVLSVMCLAIFADARRLVADRSVGHLLTQFLEEHVGKQTPTLDSGSVHEDNTVLNNDSPSSIRGLKWRQHEDDEFLQTTVDWWLARPTNISRLDLLKAVSSKANTISIRVDSEARFKEPAARNHEYAMSEVANAVREAKKHHVDLNIYFWARIWLEDGEGQPYNGTETEGQPYSGVPEAALRVKLWFTPLFTKLLRLKALDYVKGIILVEVNTHSIDTTKQYTKRIVDMFNAEIAWKDAQGRGFFETRTFIMPGAGFGLDFRNIGHDRGNFLEDMHVRCKYFAFLYKYMHASHEKVTEPDYRMKIRGIVRSWQVHMEFNDVGFTVEDRKEYLNNFGMTELTDYVSRYQKDFPRATNIVFWGDTWDGISRTPPQSRVALKELFSHVSEQVGYIFNLVAYTTTNPSARKFYLLDDNLSPNFIKGWSGIPVVDEWGGWSDSPQSTGQSSSFSP